MPGIGSGEEDLEKFILQMVPYPTIEGTFIIFTFWEKGSREKFFYVSHGINQQ